jgi:hypothetical protein
MTKSIIIKKNRDTISRETKLKSCDINTVNNLVQLLTLTEVGRIFSCSGNAIKKFCKKHFLSIPKKRRFK